MRNDDRTDTDMFDTDFERRLRESLHRDAERISPRDRRTEILAMVTDDTRIDEHQRRWVVPVAAAASVALIGAIAWGVSTSGGPQSLPASPATTTTQAATATVPVPSPSSSPSSSSSSSSSSSNGATTTEMALPAYFVGANSDTGERFGLYREFVRTSVPTGATGAQKAKAAVAVAMNAQPFTNYEPYIQPWSGTSVKGVTATASQITIELSGPGPSGFTPAQTKLAVQQLVWTAQAAIGKGTTPVKFLMADGSTKLFGTYPVSATYNRPAKELQYEDLAPIWITTPVRDQAFPSGSPVVVKGESCAFEATTQWQLRSGSAVVKSGFTTATSGCPTRGTWQVDLGVLTAGNFTFRMYETSMEDGQGVIAETSKPFSVK